MSHRNITIERRIAAGICRDCGEEPAFDDETRCHGCQAEHRADMQDRRRDDAHSQVGR